MSRPDTKLVHAGEGVRSDARSLTTPIYQTSTFLFDDAAELERYNANDGPGYIYSRHSNPTVEAVETKIAAVEGADAALVTASGMAATATALLGLLSAGDELVTSAAVYGGTVQLTAGLLTRFGVRVRLVPAAEDFASAIGPSS